MPVFFRAGCNSGGCHGAARGKDGFHLGLFGYDPAGDYFRLTQQLVGRRIDVAVPEQSLLLLKATGMVPHSGGRRFKPDSEYYKTLLRWIQAGAPDDPATVPQVTGISLQPDKFVFSGKVTMQPLQVIAKYSDGTTRDVTRLALYLTNNKNTAEIDEQGVVTAAKRGDAFVFARFAKYTVGAEMIVLPKDKHFRWPKIRANNYIDELVDAKLQKLRILPTRLATDEEFLRRVYLDIIGMLPTVDEHNRFVASKDRDKRNKLVNELLDRPEYVDLWTTKWAEALKIIESNHTSAFGTDRKAAFAYYQWIHDQIKKNTPLDQFVRKQVASTGSNLEDPAVNLYTMLPQGSYDPKAVALDVAQLFTGIRIQCSECHNHPFDRWTQDDFYGFVSFFTGVRRKTSSEAREFFIFDDPAAAPAKHLLTGQPVPAKFLGEDGPDVKGKIRAWRWRSGSPPATIRCSRKTWPTASGRISSRGRLSSRSMTYGSAIRPAIASCSKSWAADWLRTVSIRSASSATSARRAPINFPRRPMQAIGTTISNTRIRHCGVSEPILCWTRSRRRLELRRHSATTPPAIAPCSFLKATTGPTTIS
jgi:hypothetical protein